MKKISLLFVAFTFTINFVFAQEESEIIERYEQKVEEGELFTVVDKMPIFTEACDKFPTDAEKTSCTMREIQKYVMTVDYPQEAIDNDIEGKVFVSFVINKDGSVSEVTLLRGAHKQLDEASLNLLNNMPAFYKPGYQNGLAVRVKYNIPIVFKLGYSKNKALTKKEARQVRKDIRKKLKALEN